MPQSSFTAATSLPVIKLEDIYTLEWLLAKEGITLCDARSYRDAFDLYETIAKLKQQQSSSGKSTLSGQALMDFFASQAGKSQGQPTR